MARYTKRWRDGLFMGWDTLGTDAECSEATLQSDLFVKMDSYTVEIFQKLGPGETYTTQDFIEYFREW